MTTEDEIKDNGEGTESAVPKRDDSSVQIGVVTHIDGGTGELTVMPAPTCNRDEEATVMDEVEDLLKRTGVDINGKNPFAPGGPE